MTAQRFMVIVDPTLDEHPAYERALQSAQMTGAELHLYTCTCKPPFVAEGETESAAFLRFRDEVRHGMRELAARAELSGVRASFEIGCAPDFRQEMVQAAARSRANLVFKQAHTHSPAQREQRETADWLLLRLAPCPVLMVKNVRDWSGRRVLGAVNLGSHDLGHIKLNNQIISEAQRFAHGFGAEAHFAMAYPDQNRAPELAEVARICGVEPARVHLRHGNAAAVIRLLAEELAADLIIIGTVARSGLMGTVVGNTAERVLDDTTSDVLVLN